jgi:hypothetical protein
MIRYLKHDQIDFEKWDACIQSSPNAIMYAMSWYLGMTTPGWDALVEDDYRAVMPLPLKRKYGITYLYQPFFVQQLGVFRSVSLSPGVVRSFVNAIPSHVKWVDYNLNIYNDLQPAPGEAINQRITCMLDLIPSYESLRSAYSQNTRRNIKKASSYGLFITPHGKPEVIIDAFRNNKGSRLKPLDRSITIF